MNKTMAFGILLICITVFITGFYRFYTVQNQPGRMGGNISVAKVIWLGYATFYYFILSTWYLIFYLPAGSIALTFYIFICSIYARFILQGILMYKIKKWIPPYGMTFNILLAIVMALLMLSRQDSGTAAAGLIIKWFCIGAIAILLTDTLYAFLFHKLAHRQTTGEQAIWFASQDEKFNHINRITTFGNILHLTFAIILITCTFIYYDRL